MLIMFSSSTEKIDKKAEHTKDFCRLAAQPSFPLRSSRPLRPQLREVRALLEAYLTPGLIIYKKGPSVNARPMCHSFSSSVQAVYHATTFSESCYIQSLRITDETLQSSPHDLFRRVSEVLGSPECSEGKSCRRNPRSDHYRGSTFSGKLNAGEFTLGDTR